MEISVAIDEPMKILFTSLKSKNPKKWDDMNYATNYKSIEKSGSYVSRACKLD